MVGLTLASGLAYPSATHLMNPISFRPDESVRSEVKKKNPSHALFSETMSSNSITPVTSINEITTKTTMVGLMKLLPSNGRLMVGLEPHIQKNIASSTSAAMIHSLRDGGPMAASSPELHVTISGLSFTSGRHTR